MALVEVDDALDAVLVAVGVGHHRMRREDETLGLEDDVVGDQPGRRQVLLQEGRRHGERFARVVEAGLVGGIDRELAGRPDVHSGQVANRVIELGIAQPAGQDGARIAGVALGLTVAQVADPGDDRGPFVRPRLAAASSGGISSACSRSSTRFQWRRFFAMAVTVVSRLRSSIASGFSAPWQLMQ